jgi:hypothetical protein
VKTLARFHVNSVPRWADKHISQFDMSICIKCEENRQGLNGKKAAILIFLGALPFTWLFGFASGVFMIGLGLYSLIAHHPRKYVCSECKQQNCPKCQKSLAGNNFCKPCKTAICPICGSYQNRSKTLSWPATIAGIVLFALFVGFLLAGMLLDPWLVVVLLLFVLYLSAPKCIQCDEKIRTTSF